jgi:hypothetical protein
MGWCVHKTISYTIPTRFPYYAVISCIYFANKLQIHPLYGWALCKFTIAEMFSEESSVLSEQF